MAGLQPLGNQVGVGRIPPIEFAAARFDLAMLAYANAGVAVT
jgi:hypothetical protein